MIRRLLRRWVGCEEPKALVADPQPVMQLDFKLMRQFNGNPIYMATLNGRLFQKEIWPFEIDLLLKDMRKQYPVIKVRYE